MKNTKMVIILGTASGIGKGVTTSAIASLFQANQQKVLILKLSPYLNPDAKFLDPYWHGEIFVTEDGVETDIDIAHYQRFLNTPQSGKQLISIGRHLARLIKSDRKNLLEGKVINFDDIIQAIKKEIHHLIDKHNPDVLLFEVGGNVNNHNAYSTLTALKEVIKDNVESIVTIWLSNLSTNDHLASSKLNKALLKFYQKYSWIPDIYLFRNQEQLNSEKLQKIFGTRLYLSGGYSNITKFLENTTIRFYPELGKDSIYIKDSFVCLPKVEKVYLLPKKLHQTGIFDQLLQRFKFTNKLDLTKFDAYEQTFIAWKEAQKPTIKIALINKYSNKNNEFYSLQLSLEEVALKLKVNIQFDNILTNDLAKNDNFEQLSQYDGVLLPGGYGVSGTDMLIKAATYTRTNKIPTLGLCYGMQMMIIDYARNILNLSSATSEEIADNPDDFMAIERVSNRKDDLKAVIGSEKINVIGESKFKQCYVDDSKYDINNLLEIHRHGFTVSHKFEDFLKKQKQSLMIVARSDLGIVEGIELKDHPFFIGVQYHPELETTFGHPHPLYFGFVKRILEWKGHNKWKK